MNNFITLQNKTSKIQLSLSKRKAKVKVKLEPYLYLLPSILLFGLFMYYPFFKTIYRSIGLTDFKGQVAEFVGMQNYIDILTSKEFLNSLVVTMKFVVITAVPTIVIGLVLALLANNKLKGGKVFKLAFSMPMAVSSSAASIIWVIILHPTIGILNYFLGISIGWLIDSKWALVSVAFVTIWINLGASFVFLFSGLKNIPQELIESASIDGANYFQKLFKIIIPMLSPTIFFVVFMNIMHAFQSFGPVNIMTAGGPGNSTNLLVFSIYREAFFYGRFDIASAQSLILFVIMLAIAILQFKFEDKGVHYS